MKARVVTLVRSVWPAVFAGLLCGAAGAFDDWETPESPAKTFRLKDLSGHALDSHELAGKVVVVDFWATWCGPCLKELPELAAYRERIKGRNDVVLLSFNVTEERPDVVAFVKKNQIDYPVYLADDLVGPYDVVAFPTKLVIDMRGKGPGIVRFRRSGYTPIADLESKVTETLEAK